MRTFSTAKPPKERKHVTLGFIQIIHKNITNFGRRQRALPPPHADLPPKFYCPLLTCEFTTTAWCYLFSNCSSVAPNPNSSTNPSSSSCISTSTREKLFVARGRITAPRPRQQARAQPLQVVAAVVARDGEEEEEDGVADAALPPVQHVEPRSDVVQEDPSLQLLRHARVPAPGRRLGLRRLLLVTARNPRVRHRHHRAGGSFRNASPSLTGLGDVVLARFHRCVASRRPLLGCCES